MILELLPLKVIRGKNKRFITIFDKALKFNKIEYNSKNKKIKTLDVLTDSVFFIFIQN